MDVDSGATVGTDGEKIVGHLVIAGVDHLVVHREEKHVVKIAGHQAAEIIARLAVDVASLAAGRSVGLGFQRGRTQNADAMRAEGFHHVSDETIFILSINVLDDIHGVRAVERTLDGTVEHVVCETFERPGRVHPAVDVLHKYRVEIDRGEFLDFLAHNASAERIGAADFQHAVHSRKHFRNELVAGENEAQPARVIVPDLVAHQAELAAALVRQFKATVILWFFGMRDHRGLGWFIRNR